MSQTISKQLLKLLPLVLLVAGLLSYNFLSAQWQAPTATAPNNNTEAPINISANYQAKLGDLGAVRMRAGQYCNADGTVCVTASAIGGTSIGVGQTWQNVRPSRAVNTTYQNTTGRPIMVAIVSGGSNETIRVSSDNTNWVVVGVAGNYFAGNAGFVVPSGHYYRVDGNPYAGAPYWSELR